MNEVVQVNVKQEWDDLILEYGGHPFQLWAWGEVKAKHGWYADRLIVQNFNGDILGTAQVLTKKLPWPLKNFSYIPRGMFSSVENDIITRNLVADFVKSKYKSVVLSVEPHSFEEINDEGWRRTNNTIMSDETIMIDLTKDEDVLLKELDRKTRQSINRAKRNIDNIKVINTPEELDKCLDIYELTSKRSDFAIHSREYYENVFKELDSNSIIFGAYIKDELLGFLWLAISGNVSTQMYSGINESGAKNRVSYALRWHAITKTKEWGLVQYDFGGLMPGGVESFKKAWSNNTTTMAGTYDKPLSIWYPLWNWGRPLANTINQKIKTIKRHYR